jgi:hypothetical protein
MICICPPFPGGMMCCAPDCVNNPPFPGEREAVELSAEERGVIIDALIEHRASATQRKSTNPQSTSDERAAMCVDLIQRLGEHPRSGT